MSLMDSKLTDCFYSTEVFWTRRHTMAMTLDDAVGQFSEKLNLPPQIDPAFLEFLKELIKEFLPILLDKCRETSETAADACKGMLKGGGKPFRRWLGKRMVTRRTRGMPEYDVTPVQLLDAMLEVGAEASPADIESVYDQC